MKYTLVLILFILMSGCGKVTHDVNFSGEATINHNHNINITICDVFKEQEKKEECTNRVLDLLDFMEKNRPVAQPVRATDS